MERNKIAKLASKLMIEIIKTDLPNKEINRLNDIVGDIRDEAINYTRCCETLIEKKFDEGYNKGYNDAMKGNNYEY